VIPANEAKWELGVNNGWQSGAWKHEPAPSGARRGHHSDRAALAAGEAKQSLLRERKARRTRRCTRRSSRCSQVDAPPAGERQRSTHHWKRTDMPAWWRNTHVIATQEAGSESDVRHASQSRAWKHELGPPGARRDHRSDRAPLAAVEAKQSPLPRERRTRRCTRRSSRCSQVDAPPAGERRRSANVERRYIIGCLTSMISFE
jgi:hypothetical protein